jgi:hypothetical protein
VRCAKTTDEHKIDIDKVERTKGFIIVMLSEGEASLDLIAPQMRVRDSSTSLGMTESLLTDGIREKHTALWR